MKIISNDKLIKRNGRLGNILSIGSLIILGVGMFLSFRDKDGTLLPYTFGSLILGFLTFQIGNFYMSKWGKSPRPDEKLSAGLKGLDDKYTLYHYSTDVSHLLVGPAGLICLIPLSQGGTIRYDAGKDRWKQSGGNWFMKTFGGENMGKPENEARYSVSDLTKFLAKKSITIPNYEPEAILVFTNEKATIEAEGSDLSATTIAKLKEIIRKKAKGNPLSLETLKEIETKINQA
jgi:hypothetical protein